MPNPLYLWHPESPYAEMRDRMYGELVTEDVSPFQLDIEWIVDEHTNPMCNMILAEVSAILG